MPSKNDYLILGVLFENNCINEMKSWTLKNIAEKTQLSISKIRRSVAIFIDLGYMATGAQQHREKTYYATEKGCMKIKELL